MNRPHRILIVDDEETFLRSTADLLRREGYECDCASDAKAAARLLAESEFELLIADIQMAGNGDLEFISHLPGNKDVPVIVVTGYPSIRTAVRAVELPVTAYLIKPVDLPVLLAQIRRAIQTRQLLQAVATARQRLRSWDEDLKNIEEHLRLSPRDRSGAPLDTFLALTLQNIIRALGDLRLMIEIATGQMSPEDIETTFAGSRPLVLLDALRETIVVLEKTKGSFKSKELGELRRKLEDLVSGPGELPPRPPSPARRPPRGEATHEP